MLMYRKKALMDLNFLRYCSMQDGFDFLKYIRRKVNRIMPTTAHITTAELQDIYNRNKLFHQVRFSLLHVSIV